MADTPPTNAEPSTRQAEGAIADSALPPPPSVPAPGITTPVPDALPPPAAYLRPTLSSALAEPLLPGPHVGESRLEWIGPEATFGPSAFRAHAATGHTLLIDAGPGGGGTASGFEPLDLLALSLGGCTALDVISILRKKRQLVTVYQIRVATRQAQTHPQVYTECRLLHILQGPALDPRAVARAIELSAQKYCPVGAMLAPALRIIHDFRIVPAA